MQEELKHGWDMLKNGVTRAIHLRTDAIGIVLTLEVASVGEVKRYCDDFSLVENGVMDFTYIPVAPFTLWEYMK